MLYAPFAKSTDDDVPPPPPEPNGQKKSVTKAEYFVFTCKIYVNEDGTARSVEVLSTSPPMNVHNRRNREFIESIVSSIRTWTFNPTVKDGKPVAGYIIAPLAVDLAEPFKIGGGT